MKSVTINGVSVELTDAVAADLLGATPNVSLAPPRTLTPRRFWLAALSLGITEDMVDAQIDSLPEPQRSAYRIEKRHAQAYDRAHPLVRSLPQAFGVTEAALDAAWANAPA